MNKQIFLSLALVAFTSFSGALGEGTGSTENTTSSLQTGKTEKTEKIATKELTKTEQKTDVSGIRAAYNKAAELWTAHCYKIGGVVVAGASLYVIYKVMYKNCPWFKELVDGTPEAERAQLPWVPVN